MNDQSPGGNAAFRDSSFLQGQNATYVEQLYGQWAQNPASVDAAWDAFFAQIEAQSAAIRGPQGFVLDLGRHFFLEQPLLLAADHAHQQENQHNQSGQGDPGQIVPDETQQTGLERRGG